MADAGPFVGAAKQEEGAGVNVLAELTLGQLAIKSGTSTSLSSVVGAGRRDLWAEGRQGRE